ncbi:PNLIP [Branchiostoma lanceolatum]|uniref:PNLIP protein n=1 Tax=Branchiostoma lanceolatum TaxID=7740 RepID=A0A8K0A9P9_BRALA|nr:PNLIP [Branchiostoma lanceolatum]
MSAHCFDLLTEPSSRRFGLSVRSRAAGRGTNWTLRTDQPRANQGTATMYFIPLLLSLFVYPGTGAEEKVCDSDLGCFRIHEPFVPRLPTLPEKIDVKFKLHTKNNPDEPQHLSIWNIDSIRDSYFNSSRPSKFVVHGFLDDTNVDWIEDMKNAILFRDDVNMFLVDWSSSSQTLDYTQAAADIRVVGAKLARFIIFLRFLTRAEEKNMHIIGHSLGAHVAGYAGERLNGRLGRITGLDPAYPFFENKPPEVRLDTTDAIFVDVIHTDADADHKLGFGMDQAIGHLDFYPNGGQEQPGCGNDLFDYMADHGVIEEDQSDVLSRSDAKTTVPSMEAIFPTEMIASTEGYTFVPSEGPTVVPTKGTTVVPKNGTTVVPTKPENITVVQSKATKDTVSGKPPGGPSKDTQVPTLPVVIAEENCPLLGGTNYVVCNHQRAIWLFIESVNSDCTWKSYPCGSWQDFKDGKCLTCGSTGCFKMGYDADKNALPTGARIDQRLFLTTSDRDPYCHEEIHHVKVNIGKNKDATTEEAEEMFVKLKGEVAQSDSVNVLSHKSNTKISPGDSYGFVIGSRQPLGAIRSMDIRWIPREESWYMDWYSSLMGWLNEEPPSCVFLEKVEVSTAGEKECEKFEFNCGAQELLSKQTETLQIGACK